MITPSGLIPLAMVPTAPGGSIAVMLPSRARRKPCQELAFSKVVSRDRALRVDAQGRLHAEEPEGQVEPGRRTW